MRRTLQEWLDWQETLHLSEIDLGLERISLVAQRLELLKPTFPIITVAGTNGKGSTVAFVDEILRAQGYTTGVYTSPHLIDYNERIQIDGNQASDKNIIQAFEAIDKARSSDDGDETSLTYFEFSTLAAMVCFIKQDVDVAILEVGLGGRLDAANLWDATLAIITSVAIDHIEWLGDDREIIAVEKSGIMRKSAPVICGDPNPPLAIKTEAKRIGAKLIQLGVDYKFDANDTACEMDNWMWQYSELKLCLSLPSMAGEFQLNNASSAIAGLHAIKARLPVTIDSINKGLANASVTGRLEIIQSSPEWILDVAHNPHAAKELAKYITSQTINGKTYALFSMLRDKDINEVIALMDNVIDEWHIVALEGSRGLSLDELKQCFRENNGETKVVTHNSFSEACASLKKITKNEDRVVAFGSFLVVSEVLNKCK